MGKQKLLRLDHPALLELKKINMKNAFTHTPNKDSPAKARKRAKPVLVMVCGFTLIETIIAIFILAVGITAVLTIFPLGIQIVNSSKMVTTATYLAQEKIEEIISTPYGEISNESEPTLASPFNAYSRETGVTYFDPDNPGVTSSEDTGIKKIKVTVSRGVADKKIEFSILITKK